MPKGPPIKRSLLWRVEIASEPALYDLGLHRVGEVGNCLGLEQLRPSKAVRIQAGADGGRLRGCTFWLRYTLERRHHAHLVKAGARYSQSPFGCPWRSAIEQIDHENSIRVYPVLLTREQSGRFALTKCGDPPQRERNTGSYCSRPRCRGSLRSWGNDSKPPHQAIAALGAPGAAISCSGMQPEESCNEDYDDHDADEVENIHCSFRFEASAASV
jgi:hypothetical protein